MSTLTPPSPPRPDDRCDAEALEALIEEARQRARRRRRGYAAVAFMAVAPGLVAFSISSDGGDASRSSDRGEPRQVSALVTNGKWRAARGLEGGRITAFAVDPRHPATVFAATLEAGAFRSVDGAGHWQPMDLAPAVSRVDALAIAPGDPKTVYAGTERGVLKSTDGGGTWRATSPALYGKVSAQQREHRSIEGYVYALAVDRRDADVVYAGTGDGTFKTDDGGRSWQPTGLDAGPVSALAVDPQGSMVYAGAERGVFKSSDGGATWRPTGLRGTYVMTLAISPEDPQTIFAGTLRKGILTTTDGGSTWRRSGLAGTASSSLALDPDDAAIAYAATWEEGIFKTDDGGRSWRRLDAGASSSALALDPRDPGTIYAGARRGDADGGVVKSLDGGQTWRPMEVGLNAGRVLSLALDPGSPGTAYAAVWGIGVFRRVDGGWQAAGARLESRQVYAVAAEPGDPAGIYAGTDRGVFKSAGGAWRDSGSATGAAVKALAVDPHKPTTAYALAVDNMLSNYDGGPATIYESRVFKTTDGGRVWSMGTEVQTLQAPPAGTAARVPHVLSAAPLAIDPRNPDVLYAGGPAVVKSVDGGRTWRKAGPTRGPVFALAVDPAQPAIVYAGTAAGLVKSTDAGAGWQPLPGRLDRRSVEALALDPADRRTLFAGTDRGVFWSTDGGTRWRRFTGLPRRPFVSLAVDRAAGVLYAGANGGGVYELDLGR
jgi:photosystem II stability/assembly factor-like uncharacterized protein